MKEVLLKGGAEDGRRLVVRDEAKKLWIPKITGIPAIMGNEVYLPTGVFVDPDVEVWKLEEEV